MEMHCVFFEAETENLNIIYTNVVLQRGNSLYSPQSVKQQLD
jgi:hypothetical protein